MTQRTENENIPAEQKHDKKDKNKCKNSESADHNHQSTLDHRTSGKVVL